MPKSKMIVIYGAFWCRDTYKTAKDLRESGVPYRGVETENNEAVQSEVKRIVGEEGRRWEEIEIPVVVFTDGSFLANPKEKIFEKLKELKIIK